MTIKLKNKRHSRWFAWAIASWLLLTLAITLFLGREVISDLENQRSASSDNVQWTLTQVEVEFLSFVNTLEHSGLAFADNGPDGADLEEVRRQFDVFYSRIDTITSSPLFANLRVDPDFAAPLEQVTAFLATNVPRIDGSDAELQDQVGTIWQEVTTIQPHIRKLSVAGLSYFARSSDRRRAETATTLARLAALSGTLFLVLAALSVYLLFVNRTTRRRGDDLVQANQRMNTILATSLDAVIVVNSAGHVLEFNPAAEAIFGYSLEEARGRSIGDLIVPAHLRKAHSAGMERMRQGGEKHVVGKGRVQLEAMRANGEIFPVELALQSALDGEDEIVIGFVRDISRRVADEKELISARDRALAGEKAKSDFLTVMSHEIRTPLNGLLGNLSLLKNSNLSHQQNRFVHNMDISGQVLLNHVDTVLDIARFEAGKLSVEHQPTDLGIMLQEIVDSQSGNAASRGNVIEWQWVGPQQPMVATDAQRLRQILLNLVGNAIKFTADGRISIEVEVTEETQAAGAKLYEFRIIDSGCGIADAEIETVFEDFHTRDASIGRSTGGTGLGLGIARRFTKAMGGEIGVESTLDEGSVFWVRLPLEQVDLTRSSESAQSKPVRAGQLDLLVVEDNDINLEVIRNMLELDGHRVTTAMDGKSGVDAANGHRFDAILMDISMPIMDGPTATRHIRTGKGLSADVPILAVSANVLPDAVEGFRDAGMDAFIGKPISMDALRKALSAITGEQTPAPVMEHGNAQVDAMRADLGEPAFQRLLAQFISEADALMQALSSRNTDTPAPTDLAAECHKLAGSAAMFGASDLRDALIEIETMVKTQGHANLSDLTSRALDVWASTRESLPKSE